MTLAEITASEIARLRARPRAIENGVTQDELVEMITHLAFYVGWPSAVSVVGKLKELLANKEQS